MLKLCISLARAAPRPLVLKVRHSNLFKPSAVIRRRNMLMNHDEDSHKLNVGNNRLIILGPSAVTWLV